MPLPLGARNRSERQATSRCDSRLESCSPTGVDSCSVEDGLCSDISRLDSVFNLSGSEVVVIVLLALVVLGPEKLPEAVRRFGRIYAELKKMSTGFQTEFRSALDEPLRELRETADLTRESIRRVIDEPQEPTRTDGVENDNSGHEDR